MTGASSPPKACLVWNLFAKSSKFNWQLTLILKPTWEPDVAVVDILNSTMYLQCKGLGVGFRWGYGCSSLYFLAALWFHFPFVLLQMNSEWVRNRFIFVSLHSKISWLFCMKCLSWSQFGLFLITFEVVSYWNGLASSITSCLSSTIVMS